MTPGWRASPRGSGRDGRPHPADVRTWCRDEASSRNRIRCREPRSSAAWLPPIPRRVEGLPRGISRAARSILATQSGSGGLGFDLGHVARGGSADRNATRLHRFGDFPLQLDDEQAVLEAGALDLDVVGQREPALEVARRDATMQEGPLLLLALAAFERQHVLLDRESDFIGRKSGERHRDLEAVLVETFDVVGGIGLFGGPLDLVENVEKAVEPDGRPPEGSPIIPHIQILLGARWVRAGSGHRPAPVSFRGTPKASRSPQWRRQKNLEGQKKFQEVGAIFFAQDSRWLIRSCRPIPAPGAVVPPTSPSRSPTGRPRLAPASRSRFVRPRGTRPSLRAPSAPCPAPPAPLQLPSRAWRAPSPAPPLLCGARPRAASARARNPQRPCRCSWEPVAFSALTG